MDDEDGKAKRAAALLELEREDLEPWSREELLARMARLEAEIERTRQALEVKSGLRSAASALFKS